VVLCVVMLVAVWFSGMIVLLLCGCFAGGAVGSVVLYSVYVVVWSCAGVVWCGVVLCGYLPVTFCCFTGVAPSWW
jgi:hypothetical protein